MRFHLFPLLLAGFLNLLVVFPVSADEAETAAILSQEQRQEKRLLFSQYVEEEIARREREKYRVQPAAQQKPQKIWVARFSALYGYDSNPNYNSSRRGDGFFQETVSGSFRIDRPTIPAIPWTGKLGFSGYSDFLNYESFESLSYQTTVLSVFSEEAVAERHQLKLAYEMTFLRYPFNDQLTYYGHKIKPTWTFFWSNTSALSAFASYERRDYRDRKSLDAHNRPSTGGREDDYTEIGLNPKFYPTPATYISLTVAAKNNDSNDNFLDYNDYSGWKASGMLYQKIVGPVSTALVFGYDFKQYDSLTFSTRETGPAETQADDMCYAGAYLYYDITKNWQLQGSYMYRQNESNNPLLDWTGWTTNFGANLNF